MPTVLLIDDSRETRRSIKRTLECHDFNVITAIHGLEALKILDQIKPDIIITDVFMPEMDGVEIISELRKLKNKIPIIVMSGSLKELYTDLGLKLGAVSALHKPFSSGELLQAINTSLPPVSAHS